MHKVSNESNSWPSQAPRSLGVQALDAPQSIQMTGRGWQASDVCFGEYLYFRRHVGQLEGQNESQDCNMNSAKHCENLEYSVILATRTHGQVKRIEVFWIACSSVVAKSANQRVSCASSVSWAEDITANELGHHISNTISYATTC